jgi:ATP-dependent helicase/nuclease subunit A
MDYKNLYNIESNIFVFADAGSGKTTALVNRFIKLIVAGNKSEEIYCITYTNAATIEMKKRIAAKIQHLISLPATELKNEFSKIDFTFKETQTENIKKLLSTIDVNSLRISTIDSLVFSL